MNTRKKYRNFGANMICKKCGHDVDKYEVIYVGGWRKLDRRFKSNPVPYCPCGEKIT